MMAGDLNTIQKPERRMPDEMNNSFYIYEECGRELKNLRRNNS